MKNQKLKTRILFSFFIVILFKKFSRLNTPGAPKSKGTGLGLFITKEIIEKHGGTIWVEPREEGNSFIFQIEGGASS